MSADLSSAAASSHLSPTIQSSGRASRWAPWLLLFVLAWRFNIELFAGNSLGLTLSYLLPLFSAWWAARDGLAVVARLLPLVLVPDLTFREGPLSVSWGYLATPLLLAVGVAIATSTATQDVSARLPSWARWRLLGAVAVLSWMACAVQRSLLEMRDAGTLALDPMAMLAAVVTLVALDGRRLAAAIGLPVLRFHMLFALLLIALAMNFWVGLNGFSLRLGLGQAAFLLPAATFVAVLCGWVRWWRVLLPLSALVLIEQIALLTFGPTGSWLPDVRARPEPLRVLTEVVIAALLGSLFLRRRALAAHAALPTLRPAVSVPLLLLAMLVVLTVLSDGLVPTWGTALWAQAGLAFLGGHLLGLRGAIGVPLALLGASAAIAVGINPGLNEGVLASGLPNLVGVGITYGLAGAVLRRREQLSRLALQGRNRLPAIDGSAVARVVQLIDHSATSRAFVALLVPAVVLWQGADLLQAHAFSQDVVDDGDEVVAWGFWALAAAGALWPLSFVALDWLDRQDRCRWLSALTGGVFAWLGVALLTFGLGALISMVLNGAHILVRLGITVLLATIVAVICGWLYSGSRGPAPAWRRAMFALGGLLALGALALLVALGMTLVAQGSGLSEWLQVLGALLGLAVVGHMWVSAVRLRLVLAEDHPRALLFGALPQGRFWVRMGAMLGLPSTMWSTAVFRRPGAWCILLGRPLSYVGVALLGWSLALSLGVVVAGHGLFVLGKRLAAAQPWRPGAETADGQAPVLFLRSFEDDRFEFPRPPWQLRLRWFDLWSFRRNLDEAMVDEVALYGPVVALGRPGDRRAPFGASRHWASHESWQAVVTQTARRARAIVLAAGESPGLRWEFDLLRREHLIERTVLLLSPDPSRADSNRRALLWLLGDEALVDLMLARSKGRPVALWHGLDGPHLLWADTPSAAAYLVALRAHFQRIPAQAVQSLLGSDAGNG